ncbi:hypothetical protein SK069_10870 [Patulibacter brassicae]|uniref:Uncharacterized protein n=1 Tax=Patulibacter brassicae TaxID=1705717 RepID=A0ABU4VJS5_9ACTN|nr:hypothetical protein [Patulibacter brassicae]MDX8152097.1 hypothetical protein [Patulibacter brassicae]
MARGAAHDVALGSPDWGREMLRQLSAVALAAPDREVAGVLVGDRDADGAISSIGGMVEAAEGTQLGQAAMFGHDIWAAVRRKAQRRFAGLEVVGWYLSRPGYGTALLPADEHNHRTWFASGQQLLLLIDSRTLRGAMYLSDGQRLVCVHEGPIERRYLRPTRPGVPALAVGLLLILGAAIGTTASFLLAAL